MRSAFCKVSLCLALLIVPRVGHAQADGVVIKAGPETKATLSIDDVAQLPATKVKFATDHGKHEATFEGPLLWTVLEHSGAISAKQVHAHVRQTVAIAGSDGYTAILALGEISPEFEGKQVILAEREDDKPLAAGHLRIIVPGDHRGGRSVHDVVSITVSQVGN
jgi:hypothetical protein